MSETEMTVGNLTSGRLLVRNSIWNLLGSTSPTVVAVVCIPILLHALGKDRFGVLTLAWALVGYANFFDLGLGRALTQVVASKLGTQRETEIAPIAWTSLLLMLALGLVAALVIVVISPWLVGKQLNVPLAIRPESILSFQLLGLSVPFVITTAGLRGLLEAHQLFGLTNALRIPMGVLTFLGPVLALAFSRTLIPVMLALVISRFVTWVAYLVVCLRVLPELRRSIGWQREFVAPLLSYGGWMTATNVIGPILVTLDRFVIGALVSLSAVAYYATPWEVVTKVLLIPGALMGVMFPAFSTGYAQDEKRTAELFRRSIKLLFIILFPVMLLLIALAHEGLSIWLGSDFAQQGYRVFQLLAVGVFINCLSLVPFTFIQGVGRPDLSAKLHLFELPVYIGLLWWMIRLDGIQGAAIAWDVRASVDAVFLFIMAGRLMKQKGSLKVNAVLIPILSVTVFAAAAFLHGPITKLVFLVAVMLSFGLVIWYRVLTPDERMLVQNR